VASRDDPDRFLTLEAVRNVSNSPYVVNQGVVQALVGALGILVIVALPSYFAGRRLERTRPN
jgi:uncharacterized membrane protein